MVCKSAIAGNINAAREIADHTETKTQQVIERSVTTGIGMTELRREKLTIAVQNGLDMGWCVKRVYSDSQVAEALAVVDACGGNILRASQTTGVPRKTLEGKSERTQPTTKGDPALGA